MPLISVIIPVYNTENTLARCLDSILSQTLTDFEIVIVNDGSPDQSQDIIDRYKTNDCRITSIWQKNQGLGAARNTGIKYAKGDYLAFVDSDDECKPDFLLKLYNSIKQNKSNLAICEIENVCLNKNGQVRSLGFYRIPSKENAITAEKALCQQLNLEVPILFNTVCPKLIEKKLFIDNNIQFPEQHRYGEDTQVSITLFAYAKSVSLVHEALYLYYHNDNTLTTSYSLKKALDIYLDTVDIIEVLIQVKPNIHVDNFVLSMLFPLEKQMLWAQKQDTDKPTIAFLEEQISQLRELYKPNFDNTQTPLIQKIKISIAYHNQTKNICQIIRVFRWLPFIKYMV